MKFLIIFVLLSVIFAQESFETNESEPEGTIEGKIEIDHSGETEDVLEFESPDIKSE